MGAVTARRRSTRLALGLATVAVLGMGAVSAASTATTATRARSTQTSNAATSSPIQHIVFIYRENHSFDNMFAIYCVRTHKCDGTTGMVTLSGGRTLATRPAADLVPDVCHTAGCQRTAVHGGAMDGFDLINGCFKSQKYACLQQFQPNQIPTATWMADHGVLADRFFSETNPSAGAHMFFFTGEDKQGFVGDNPTLTPPGYTAKPGWGCDSNKQGRWTDPTTQSVSLQWFCNPNASWLPNGGAPGATQVKGVPDFFTAILKPRGITWKNYGEPKPGGNWAWNVAPYHAAALAQNAGHVTAERQILNDARLGRLPNVSIVTPAQNPDRPGEDTSQHNADSMALGDNFINDVLRAVQSGKQAASTAVLLLYDDCGCFYDHVPPPAGLGIRVPLLIWSKWAKAGTVDHKPAQFASVLAFIEHNFGLPSLTSLNPNAQDGRVTNDLMGNFTFTKAGAANAPMAGSDPPPPRQQIPAAEMRWLRAHTNAHENDDT
jgi:phospholipase C